MAPEIAALATVTKRFGQTAALDGLERVSPAYHLDRLALGVLGGASPTSMVAHAIMLTGMTALLLSLDLAVLG